MQVPNFVLAAPIIALACAAVVTYVRRQPATCLTIGNTLPTSWLPGVLKRSEQASSGFGAPDVFVFVVQLAAMLSFGAVFMHIQVRSQLGHAAATLKQMHFSYVCRGMLLSVGNQILFASHSQYHMVCTGSGWPAVRRC